MTDVVTCILKNDEGKILILKRSDKVWTYRGYWGGVAGYIEKGEKPIQTAFKEIREEAGLDESEVTLVKELDTISFEDVYNGKKFDWTIHPFLFKVEKKGKVQIDWEHTEYRWIKPQEITKFDTVPHLKNIVRKISI